MENENRLIDMLENLTNSEERFVCLLRKKIYSKQNAACENENRGGCKVID